jgi:hypothetical protein
VDLGCPFISRVPVVISDDMSGFVERERVKS